MTAALAWMDSQRARVLRFTLSFGFLRSIFLSRSARLFCAFTISSAFYLAAALLFPLWVLFLGPLILGVPHLLASIRYVQKDLGRAHSGLRAVPVFAGLFTLTAAYRAGAQYGWFGDVLGKWSPNGLELVAMAAILFAIPVIFKRNRRELAGALAVFAPLALASYFYPLATVGALVLVHNLVAFAFWYRSSNSRSEKISALAATVVFVAVNALIFAGAFDFVQGILPASFEILGGQLSVFSIGNLVFPGAEDARLLFHAVVAYAFGQSIHYFVWLQAVPQQNHAHSVPPSFKKSAALIKKDLGRVLPVAGIILCAAVLAVWLFVNVSEARFLYFAWAGFHGYLELAALGFKPSKAA